MSLPCVVPTVTLEPCWGVIVRGTKATITKFLKGEPFFLRDTTRRGMRGKLVSKDSFKTDVDIKFITYEGKRCFVYRHRIK